MASAASTCVGTYCTAQIKSDKLEKEYDTRVEPLNKDLNAIKLILASFMEKTNQTCVPVTIDGKQLYLRITTSRCIKPINKDSIRTVIGQIKQADLEKTIQETPKIDTLSAVWTKTFEAMMKKNHSRETSTLTLGSSCEKNTKATQRSDIPTNIMKEIEMFHKLSNLVKELTLKFNTASKHYSKTIEQVKPELVAMLEETDLKKTLNISVSPNEQKKAILKCEKTSRPVDVRITAFKPLVKSTLDDVFIGASLSAQHISQSLLSQTKVMICDKLIDAWTILKNRPRKTAEKLSLVF